MKIRYNKNLKELARKMRNNSTKSEVILWNNLKKKRMMGYDFHRQKPIDRFIVDFFCNRLKLAIELDGYSHNFEDVLQKDEIKEQRLNELGIFILRFDDEEVMKDIDNVLRRIEGYIEEFENNTPPAPLDRGEPNLKSEEKRKKAKGILPRCREKLRIKNLKIKVPSKKRGFRGV